LVGGLIEVSGAGNVIGRSRQRAINVCHGTHRNVGRIEQQFPVLAVGRAGVDLGSEIEVAFAGSFDESTVTALLAASRGDAAPDGGVAVGPDDDLAAIAVLRGIRVDRAALLNGDVLGVGRVGVDRLAVEVAADADLSATAAAAGVYPGAGVDLQGGRGQVDLAALAQTAGVEAATHGGALGGNQPDFSSVGHHGAGGLNRSLRVDELGVQGDLPGDQAAKIENAAAGVGNFKLDVGRGAVGQIDLGASGQQDVAVGGVNDAGVFDIGGNQQDAAAGAGTDGSFVFDRTSAIALKAKLAGQIVGIAEVKR